MIWLIVCNEYLINDFCEALVHFCFWLSLWVECNTLYVYRDVSLIFAPKLEANHIDGIYLMKSSTN